MYSTVGPEAKFEADRLDDIKHNNWFICVKDNIQQHHNDNAVQKYSFMLLINSIDL